MATQRRLPPVAFDGELMTRDAAGKGWGPRELAEAAEGVSSRTVYRFLSNEIQTVATAKKLAQALGYSVRRYLSEGAGRQPERKRAERRDGDRRTVEDRRRVGA